MGISLSLGYAKSPAIGEVSRIALPRVMLARQRFAGAEVADVGGTVRDELRRLELRERLKPGASVAITVGSRGISSIAQAAAAIVAEVRACGGDPFIVPAMGSHGGASAEGQLSVLRDLGVTEASVRAPIRASMEVVELGRLPRGMPVYVDKHAAGADAIILLNRIKPHSPWGHIGSGLMKVSTIGLGKQTGCNTIHSWTVGSAQLYHTIVETFEFIRQRLPVVLAVGIIDNAYGKPTKIVAVDPAQLPEVEPGLRREADRNVGRLPFSAIDVLVLDEMGKNTSPGGVDPLVIGRPKVDPDGKPIAGQPDVRCVVVLDLTEQSHGNAIGMGSVDVTTARLAGKIDLYATYMNAISACSTEGGRLPLVLPSDREAIQVAALTCGLQAREALRLVRAKNSKKLDEFYLSEALVPELAGHPSVEPIGELQALPFDEQGNLF